MDIDGCRVEPTGESRERAGESSQGRRYTSAGSTNFAAKPGGRGGAPEGRWPANFIHDGSREVLALFLSQSGAGALALGAEASASRFFYCAKASRQDRNEGLLSSVEPAVTTDATMRACEDADWAKRNGNHHPTVKPTDLMAYLVRLRDADLGIDRHAAAEFDGTRCREAAGCRSPAVQSIEAPAEQLANALRIQEPAPVARASAALRNIGARDVTVNVNSSGGDFFEGVAIYNMLREHKAKVTVNVMGIAASAASVIAMAGDEIMMGDGAFLMIHNAWAVAMGNGVGK